jgi:uncharacterized protein (TIGR02246 family)
LIETSPAELMGGDQAFAAAINAGDIETIIAKYEPNAVLVEEPGEPAVGKAAIREKWLKVLALKPHAELHPRSIYRTGDLALYTADWSIEGTDQGAAVSLKGQVVVVLRRQPDGRWLLVLDNLCPF